MKLAHPSTRRRASASYQAKTRVNQGSQFWQITPDSPNTHLYLFPPCNGALYTAKSTTPRTDILAQRQSSVHKTLGARATDSWEKVGGGSRRGGGWTCCANVRSVSQPEFTSKQTLASDTRPCRPTRRDGNPAFDHRHRLDIQDVDKVGIRRASAQRTLVGPAIGCVLHSGLGPRRAERAATLEQICAALESGQSLILHPFALICYLHNRCPRGWFGSARRVGRPMQRNGNNQCYNTGAVIDPSTSPLRPPKSTHRRAQSQ
ncbi:hypothetical protein DFP72DRAFT_952195 [Ephemerocybe angulata]|uniref:Uncharacterized protein n=1 Tax=Ephemerocybe angulata TaxID=980116 RepID=A0A8H6LSN8_9AGAR|nr:hypothetical protein DFP72DRAFT_952195 [Tulosesus angulatus]